MCHTIPLTLSLRDAGVMRPTQMWHRRYVPLELPPIPGVQARDPVLRNLDGQIRWYDANAQRSRLWHFRLRGAQIVFAAIIPITQIVPPAVGWRITVGVLGGLIAVCQGFDSMHHYGDHYVAWRSTCQQLLRERQLFTAGAGDYASLGHGSREALSRLAARTDAIEGHELQRWTAGQRSGPRAQGDGQASDSEGDEAAHPSTAVG
jgi:Protein of unknown function (DUF4231)